ncbi:MAG: MBL fold metallo-hydrolase [Pseudobdellovibrionaceae bacterium]
MVKLQFLGGAGTVTGSKYLLTAGDKNILVDCGLFQGLKNLRLQNWDPFLFPPSDIDAILLTHAHIDHSGYIPLLVKSGFRGKIYSTAATKDLCKILLPDSGHLAEEEAAFLNRHKKTKHKPALPLFTIEDAEASLVQFEAVPFDQVIQISNEIGFQFKYAGHILGAASVIVYSENLTIGFTGDIGRPEDPILFAPNPFPQVDYLVTESTYGNRKHDKVDPKNEIKEMILEIVQTKGVIIIPSFAVGRAQELMFYLWQLKRENQIPNIPMYLNSPMATNVNAIFLKYHELHKLSETEAQEICDVVTYVRSVEESKELNEQKGPMLIISASGMMTGGRVLHHVKQFGPDVNTIILLAGFQAAGTRGEALMQGATEIKIHGEYIPMKAKVRLLGNISAHADYEEIINWFKASNLKPKKTFITHGEASAADALRLRLTDALGWQCIIPSQGQTLELNP